MKNITINSINIKSILIFTLAVHALTLCFFLTHNAGTNRFVTIQHREVGGIVFINNLKHTTAYTLNQARIKWVIDNPMDYLFLSSDEVQESVAGAILKLALTVLLCTFLWRVDFYDTFRPDNFKRLLIIYWIFVIAIAQELIKNVVSGLWARDSFRGSGYQYKNDTSAYLLCTAIIVFTVIVYLYGKAVKNQEELELTI